MHRKDKPRSSWESFVSFPQKFSYEVNAPIETVTHHLIEMEQEPMLFRRSSQEMSLLACSGSLRLSGAAAAAWHANHQRRGPNLAG